MKPFKEVMERYRLIKFDLDQLSEDDDEHGEFEAMVTALGWVLGLNSDLPDKNIWRSGPESADSLLRRIEASGRTGEILLGVSYTLGLEGIRKVAEGGFDVPDEWKFILTALNKALSADKPVLTELEVSRVLMSSESILQTDQDPWLTFLAFAPDMIEQGCLVVVRGEVK